MNQAELIKIIDKVVSPWKRRILNFVVRATVNIVVEGGGVQKLQLNLLADEVSDGIERVSEYGFTSFPNPGAEAVVVFLGGNRDHGVVIGVDDRRTRPKDMAAGDVSVWTSSGTRVWLKDSSKNIELTLNKLKISNDSNELIAVLSELLAFLVNARTNTLAGPQPLYDVTGADTLTAIKIKLDSFKE